MINKFSISKFSENIYQLHFPIGKVYGSIFFMEWEWEEEIKQMVFTSKDSLFSTAYLPLKKEIFEEKIRLADEKWKMKMSRDLEVKSYE